MPWWITFNKEPSAEVLRKYLGGTYPYDEIFMTLFTPGVDSIGLVSIEKIPARYPMPGSLALGKLEDLIEQAGDRYPVEFA